MLYIKNIFKACVCSFCENVYKYNSIDTNEFIKLLKYYLKEEDLEECLECCIADVAYDIENIENICDNLYVLKYKQFKEDDIVNICKNAFIQTIKIDKTINIEAFVDNLTKCFSKYKKGG